jgi:diaminopimelate decarboxylase
MRTESYSELVRRYGYPFYLYEEESVAGQLALLRRTFPDFRVLYSIKTNPHPAVCAFLAEQGTGADAASSYEVRKALDAGFLPDRIYYSAPGKTPAQLADALGKCQIIADSYQELSRLDQLAGERKGDAGGKILVGLRVNPDFSFGPGEFPEIRKGVGSKFGVDEESLPGRKSFFRSLKHIRPAGIHVFLRSQVLSHVSIAASFEAAFRAARLCVEELDWDIRFINFGGGIGISSAGPELDADGLRDAVGDLVSRYAGSLPGCELLLESGRFLVGKGGTFISKIEDIKESRGTTYAIVPGGLSGFLRPSVLSLLQGLPCEVRGPLEPLFSNFGAHAVSLPENHGAERKRVTVCGSLCTSLDVLAADALLPDPKVGDIVAVRNAGAYAATLSPFAFASFPRPVELFRRQNGEIAAS